MQTTSFANLATRKEQKKWKWHYLSYCHWRHCKNGSKPQWKSVTERKREKKREKKEKKQIHFRKRSRKLSSGQYIISCVVINTFSTFVTTSHCTNGTTTKKKSYRDSLSLSSTIPSNKFHLHEFVFVKSHCLLSHMKWIPFVLAASTDMRI